MTTKAQIKANRQNAKKSTGPKTARGKAAISKNAVKHGLSTSQTVICSESWDDFNLYREKILAELEPQTPMESILTERIVNLSWRLKRSSRIQNETIDALHKNNNSSLASKLIQSMLKKPEPDPDLALGHLAIKDFSNGRVLERLLMYERRIENSLYKTILELQRLNLIKKMNTGYDMSFNQLTNQPTNHSTS